MRKLRDLYGVAKHELKETVNPPKPKQKKFLKVFVWVLVIVAILAVNFFYSGKLAADYLLDNVNPYSFLKDGKYLIIFQNNSELRGTGGFIGSFAVLETKDYKLNNLSFETNIYKLDSAFTKTNYVKAPEPIARFIHGKSWTLRDSNYDVSFPEAARDIEDFYQKEANDTVDGVIAVNASLVQDLLKITGPIEMPKYNTTITSENFLEETQIKIQKDYYLDPENAIENEPKMIIKDLYPEVVTRAFAGNKLQLMETLLRELQTKNILVFFNDSGLENIVLDKGWGGEVKNNIELKHMFGTLPDYLNINVSNFGGNKSSLSVSSQIEYQVDPSGLANLTISRIHHGTTDWPDGVNSSYLRILVPLGSVLKTAELNGEEIEHMIDTNVEADKTLFATTVLVGPGQASILKISYQLPFQSNNYKLALQKQPGTPADDWKIIYDKRVLFSGGLTHDLFLK